MKIIFLIIFFFYIDQASNLSSWYQITDFMRHKQTLFWGFPSWNCIPQLYDVNYKFLILSILYVKTWNNVQVSDYTELEHQSFLSNESAILKVIRQIDLEKDIVTFGIKN